jgi:hypothetical protein
MQVAKRAAVVLAALTSEAVVLGILFGFLTIPESMGIQSALIATLPVVVVLFLHGYYFTRPLCGMIWSGTRPWLYAGVAALLFVVHTVVAVIRLYPSFTREAQVRAPVFIAVGAAMVFTCAWLERQVLARWTAG